MSLSGVINSVRDHLYGLTLIATNRTGTKECRHFKKWTWRCIADDFFIYIL